MDFFKKSDVDEYNDLLREYNDLLHEAERLRAEVAHEKGARIAAYTSGALDGQGSERTAVVAWLREGARNHRGFGVRLIGDELEAYADSIERGDHRRKENK